MSNSTKILTEWSKTAEVASATDEDMYRVNQIKESYQHARLGAEEQGIGAFKKLKHINKS